MLNTSKIKQSICSTKVFKGNIKKQTVFVGLSGGVDSSVSAYLLKREGYNVVGAFIKIWQPDVLCSWKDDRRSAMQAAAHLGIPFVTIDLSQEYKKSVIDYMIQEYTEGRTPNPDVMCNKEIKFKAFLNKSLEMGADCVATGHYARVSQQSNLKHTQFELLKAKDKAKEQSYFLWTLTQCELSKILFPIGHLQKKAVRYIAEKAGLHTFEKKDSQGLCFIGKLDFKDFLKMYIEEKRGDVLNEKGEAIGYHNGSMFLTLGERKGFVITKKTPNDLPLYIVAKDNIKNTITVTDKAQLEKTNTNKRFSIIHTNWIIEKPIVGRVYDAQVRYHQEYQKCTIEMVSGEESLLLFENSQICAGGQSIVLYDGDVCMGGGVIK